MLCPARGRADVLDHAANGFSIRVAVDVGAPAATVWAALIDVKRWWSADHTFSGNAANLSIDARPGGCFCEQLPNGGVRHLTVVYADSGKLLRLNGGLGPLQDLAVSGAMQWKLTEAAGKTSLELTYKVGGYAPGGVDPLASPVNDVLTEQVQRLKSFVETGRPR